MPPFVPTPLLCKVCVHYDPDYKTCNTSVIAVSKTQKYYDFAKSVRQDPKRCGPSAVRFSPVSTTNGADINKILEKEMSGGILPDTGH